MEPKRVPKPKNIEQQYRPTVDNERPSLELIYDADADIAEMETSRIEDEVHTALAAFDYALNEKSDRVRERLQQLNILSRWLERRYTNITAIEAHLEDYRKWVLEMRTYMSEAELTDFELEIIKKQIEETTISARVDAEIAEVLNVPDLKNVDFIDRPDMEASLEKGPLSVFKVDGVAKREKRPDDEIVGEYGQDGYMMNPHTGAVIQWDGAGSWKDSYEVGRLAALRIDEILAGVPDTANVNLIYDYISTRWSEVGQAVFDGLPEDSLGGAVLSATIPLPHSRLLVTLKVGDSEIVTAINGQIEERAQQKEKIRMTTGVGVLMSTTAKKPKYRPEDLQDGAESHENGKPIRTVRSVNPIIDIVPVPEGATVSVYQTSDGLVANTGKRLVDHIRERTLPQVLEEKPNEKDDMVITKAVTRFE